MTGFFGADTERLREQGTSTTTGARTLAEVVEAALALSHQVAWVGPDADTFRGGCDDARRQLHDALETLQRMAEELQDHADQQDDASQQDNASDGPGLPFGPFGPILPGNPFGPGGPFDGDSSRSPFGPIGSPLGPLGPLTDKVLDKVFDDKSYSIADRLENWGKEAGNKGWEWAMDKGSAAKDSKLFNFGRKVVPVVPDLFEISHALGEGKTEEAFWKTNRAMFEALPGVTVGDLLLGEATDRLGDEHTVFDSDIQWNDGTPMDGLEAYMIQKTEEIGSMKPGEQYGEDWADKLGVENQTARNVMSSVGGIGVHSVMGSAPVQVVEHGTDYNLQQKIWDGINKPLDW